MRWLITVGIIVLLLSVNPVDAQDKKIDIVTIDVEIGNLTNSNPEMNIYLNYYITIHNPTNRSISIKFLEPQNSQGDKCYLNSTIEFLSIKPNNQTISMCNHDLRENNIVIPSNSSEILNTNYSTDVYTFDGGHTLHKVINNVEKLRFRNVLQFTNLSKFLIHTTEFEGYEYNDSETKFVDTRTWKPYGPSFEVSDVKKEIESNNMTLDYPNLQVFYKMIHINLINHIPHQEFYIKVRGNLINRSPENVTLKVSNLVDLVFYPQIDTKLNVDLKLKQLSDKQNSIPAIREVEYERGVNEIKAENKYAIFHKSSDSFPNGIYEITLIPDYLNEFDDFDFYPIILEVDNGDHEYTYPKYTYPEVESQEILSSNYITANILSLLVILVYKKRQKKTCK